VGMKREHVMCWECNNQPTARKYLFLNVWENVPSQKIFPPLFIKPQGCFFTSTLQHAPIISHINPVHSSHSISLRFVLTLCLPPIYA
jgi:hypothetical protein